MEFFAENLYACTFDTTDKVWYYTGTTDPSPYQSVVDAMWWAVVTLTTVGCKANSATILFHCFSCVQMAINFPFLGLASLLPPALC